MQQSKYRGCINTAAVVSIPLRRFLCIRFESILQERKPNSLWLFSVRCRHIASDHRAVATWPSSGGRWKFRKKTEITEERTKKAGVHLSHCQASAAPCLCEKEVGILRKKCTASCSRAYDRARKNQANTQVTFIKSLADRITFQAYLEFLQTAITENVPYACDGVRHIFFIDIFRISCDSDSR